jgi:hypothetical protein
MSFCQILTADQKALDINLDQKIYGTFAEIGAGQEVARHFFRAGAAAGTVAKTISAYDMIMSDTIYGKTQRYVSLERLEQMLEYEYQLLSQRLKKREDSTQFFSFSNTVQAKSFMGTIECHGWLGVQFQHTPKAAPSLAIIHIQMLDNENLQQQEALGIIGANLIYACFRQMGKREAFISGLMDGLTTDRIQIDMIDVRGPAFENQDGRLYSLELVKKRFCQAIMFNSKGKPLRAADALYKKHLAVLRGSFRPPTLVNLDMLNTGLKKFKASLPESEHDDVKVIPEISMSKLIERGAVDNEDFLARVDLLAALGQGVLISGCDDFHELNLYLSSYSKKKLAFIVGVYNLEEILSPDNYKDFQAGILGGLGELLGHQTKLYVYPATDDDDEGQLRTLYTMRLDHSVEHLYNYLCANQLVEEITDFDHNVSGIWSRVVLEMIQKGEPGWEEMVPEIVAKAVKKKSLFGSQKS